MRWLNQVRYFLAVLVAVSGCANDTAFVSQSLTEFFVQDFNPPHLDVLWIVDDRSPMTTNQVKLVDNAKAFFQRISAVSSDYRMAFITMDMDFHPAKLQPLANPTILTPGIGTQAQRLQTFGNIMSQIINLNTSAFNKGLSASLQALSTTFVPRPNVPVVLVYLSYSDDSSQLPAGESNAVSYFKNQLLAKVGGREDLLRVYAINYVDLPSGVSANTLASLPYRCAQPYQNAIDGSSYEARYFNLASTLSGASADLCSQSALSQGFGEAIDLSGLRLKELPRRFQLKTQTPARNLTVVVQKAGQTLAIPWVLDEITHEVVFDYAPAEGSTIQVTYGT